MYLPYFIHFLRTEKFKIIKKKLDWLWQIEKQLRENKRIFLKFFLYSGSFSDTNSQKICPSRESIVMASASPFSAFLLFFWEVRRNCKITLGLDFLYFFHWFDEFFSPICIGNANFLHFLHWQCKFFIFFALASQIFKIFALAMQVFYISCTDLTSFFAIFLYFL